MRAFLFLAPFFLDFCGKMKKIKLDIIGLTYSQGNNGAYALILGESAGNRRLPIIIGGFEAQSIAIELEKMTPTRPLTHDLFKSLAKSFNLTINEVIIYNLIEGVFYAKLICSNGEEEVEIDARTSDAIALAVRFTCPIYAYEFIVSSAGIIMDEDGDPTDKTGEEQEEVEVENDNPLTKFTLQELKEELGKALQDEEYERASQIRDELAKRKHNSQ